VNSCCTLHPCQHYNYYILLTSLVYISHSSQMCHCLLLKIHFSPNLVSFGKGSLWLVHLHTNVHVIPPCVCLTGGNPWFFLKLCINWLHDFYQFCFYLCCVKLDLFLTTKKHYFDVQPSSIPTFSSFQLVIYFVGLSKDCYGTNTLVTFKCPTTSVPSFNWIGVRFCELEWFCWSCEKQKETTFLYLRNILYHFPSQQIWYDSDKR